MFNTTAKIDGKTKGVAVRFVRPDADTTICKLKIGGTKVHPKNMKKEFIGTCKCHKIDKFDKSRGHLEALTRAIDAAEITNRKARRSIYAGYSAWAQENHVNTNISLKNIGTKNRKKDNKKMKS